MPTQLQVVLAILAGGALGSVTRVGLVFLVRQATGDTAVGTMAVNVLGCFAFGLCWSLHAGNWPKFVEFGLFAGFFGAFTTFSTFAFECLQLLERGRTVAFVFQFVGQNVLGGLAMLGGISLGRWL